MNKRTLVLVSVMPTSVSYWSAGQMRFRNNVNNDMDEGTLLLVGVIPTSVSYWSAGKMCL
jgi:DNA-binding transcriptional regulator YdaS (Cro superfamily)